MGKIAAFFDVDQTLINTKSMFSFFEFWCGERSLDNELKLFTSNFKRDALSGKSREYLNKQYYKQFSNVKYNDLIEAGERWFKEKSRSDFFIDKAIEELKIHQRQGVLPVFVSGSMYPILAPIGNYLGVNDILCAPVIINPEGFCTGEIGQPQTIGLGKKEVILMYCKKHEINPRDCFAYGDHITDVPMLEATGNPVCVGNDKFLSEYAYVRGWSHI